MLLRSDGHVVACGDQRDGQCNIPSLEEGTWYTQVSAGAFRTVLLRSDGCAVTRGTFSHFGASIPPEGISCTQVSVGVEHTVLLQSDGRTVTSGMNLHGQCNIPILDEGLSYTEVSACFCRG